MRTQQQGPSLVSVTLDCPACPRCYSQDPVVWPTLGARIAFPLWVGGLCFVVFVGPLMVIDLMITLPLTMMYLLAGGPLFALSRQLPTCKNCGLERPTPGWHETPCRPVRPVEDVHRALRVEPTQPRTDDETSGVRPLPQVEDCDD